MPILELMNYGTIRGASQMVQGQKKKKKKCLQELQETWVQLLRQEDSLK